jgi:hypothetical protein
MSPNGQSLFAQLSGLGNDSPLLLQTIFCFSVWMNVSACARACVKALFFKLVDTKFLGCTLGMGRSGRYSGAAVFCFFPTPAWINFIISILTINNCEKYCFYSFREIVTLSHRGVAIQKTTHQG